MRYTKTNKQKFNHSHRPIISIVTASCLDDLLKTLKEDVGVLLLEDQHGPEADSLRARATDVDAEALGLLEELVAARRVPGDEGALALATKVLEVLGELLGELLETGVEVVAGLCGVLDEVLALDLSEDGAEEDGASGVTEPARGCISICFVVTY